MEANTINNQRDEYNPDGCRRGCLFFIIYLVLLIVTICLIV